MVSVYKLIETCVLLNGSSMSPTLSNPGQFASKSHNGQVNFPKPPNSMSLKHRDILKIGFTSQFIDSDMFVHVFNTQGDI